MRATPIIQAQAVSKDFGKVQALTGMDLEVFPGECVGLLGPNGAGKSTFIGCLYGSVLRSGGKLHVFGFDPVREARKIKQRIGVVPQENALDEGLSVTENMRLYARFGGVSPKRIDPRINELLEHMALTQKKDATILSLSGGMKRRLTFVRALLADPELLILDEPTTGLDPSVRHLLWEKVQSYRKSGKTVLLTTHYMHEAEVLCDRIIVMNKGRVVATGSPKELIQREVPGYVGLFALEEESRLQSKLQPGWTLFKQGQNCCIRTPKLEELLSLQESSGIQALQLRPSNLEDVYLKLTGQELGHDD